MADEEREEREERMFKREEAEALLPAIAQRLSGAILNKKRVDELDSEFSQVQNRILLQGGLLPTYGPLARKRMERESLAGALRDAVSEIESNGCVVKDLEMGLVDFPSMVNDEQVFLCWKLGEPAIRFWHRTDEGFAGRKPLGPSGASGPEDKKPN
ncbi:MAG: DUF2203 domain-containing protein [Candidatus Acidiferrales bacterium]